MPQLIRPVSYAEVLGAPELLKEYGGECSIPEIGQINPQADLYAQMERSGSFQVFGAFNPELVGFGAVLDYLNPHYGLKIATVESLFLAQASRAGRDGNGLMNALEDHGREKECQSILYSAKAGSQFERLLSNLSPYIRTHSVFLRRLRP